MKRKADDAAGAPLMKRHAKAAMPSTAAAPAPPSKAPISKMPPAGKAPISKMPPMAPIAKRPPTAQAGAAAPGATSAASFAKRPPPPIPSKSPGEGFSKAPPASPGSSSPTPVASPDNSGDQPSRGASWQEFSDVDPLYALLGELGEKKVTKGDDEMDEERLVEYIERLVVPGVAKPKDWIEVWAAMNIPVNLPTHSYVCQQIVEHGVRSEVGDTIGEVLAELVKGHRAKINAVEDALKTVFEFGCDEKGCIARFLLLIFPKSPTSEWGWSRVGWSWKEWWSLSDKIFRCLEPSGAFETLQAVLSSIETESGTYLPHQQIWDEKRLAIIRTALCKYGSLQEDELAAAVDISLS